MAKENETPANNVGRVVLPASSSDRPGPPIEAGEPERDAAGQLTRAGMAAVIASGQSVMLGGKSYWRIDDLPSQEDITKFREQQKADNAKDAATLARKSA